MVACTGWTWDYVADEIDIDQIIALNKYYAENPPTHLMIKAYLGIGEKKKAEDEQDFGQFMSELQEGGLI